MFDLSMHFQLLILHVAELEGVSQTPEEIFWLAA